MEAFYCPACNLAKIPRSAAGEVLYHHREQVFKKKALGTSEITLDVALRTPIFPAASITQGLLHLPGARVIAQFQGKADPDLHM